MALFEEAAEPANVRHTPTLGRGCSPAAGGDCVLTHCLWYQGGLRCVLVMMGLVPCAAPGWLSAADGLANLAALR